MMVMRHEKYSMTLDKMSGQIDLMIQGDPSNMLDRQVIEG